MKSRVSKSGKGKEVGKGDRERSRVGKVEQRRRVNKSGKEVGKSASVLFEKVLRK